jgi:hypothetical protein
MYKGTIKVGTLEEYSNNLELKFVLFSCEISISWLPATISLLCPFIHQIGGFLVNVRYQKIF